ncbi:MAG: ABC transporter ATP-binding protein [Candidatus Alcyoniella australis]|nr:ABC transporter ATP-binding protein [Candidatus Alcyoniella australis]
MSERTLIQVRDLRKSFNSPGGELTVLSELQMQIKAGELLGIVGASGVGKTTLLYILGALERPSAGEVLFEGRAVNYANDRSMARFRNTNVGFVFQMHHLIPEFNALENVTLPLLMRRVTNRQAVQRASRALEQVGLRDRLRHMPGALSGGEQQRVAIARALVTDPPMVLADEPTGNLDRDTGDRVFELIRQINGSLGTTFVIVTHNERLAARMDRVVQLEGGMALPRFPEAPRT